MAKFENIILNEILFSEVRQGMPNIQYNLHVHVNLYFQSKFIHVSATKNLADRKMELVP